MVKIEKILKINYATETMNVLISGGNFNGKQLKAAFNEHFKDKNGNWHFNGFKVITESVTHDENEILIFFEVFNLKG